jgi:uncharacterized protein YpmB
MNLLSLIIGILIGIILGIILTIVAAIALVYYLFIRETKRDNVNTDYDEVDD